MCLIPVFKRLLEKIFYCICPEMSPPSHPSSIHDKPTSPEPQAATGIKHPPLQHQYTQVSQLQVTYTVYEHQG